eukprot:UN05768
MSSNGTTSQPDSNDSTTVVIIVSVIVAVALVLVICCVFFYYYKRKKKIKSQYGRYGKTDETEMTDDAPITDDVNTAITAKPFDTNVTTNSTKSTKGFTQINDNGDEGLMSDNDDKRFEIQQWFNDNVGLSQDDNIKYTDLFIQNGYDAISAFRYINKNELDMMGIDNRAHQRIILESTNKQHT